MNIIISDHFNSSFYRENKIFANFFFQNSKFGDLSGLGITELPV